MNVRRARAADLDAVRALIRQAKISAPPTSLHPRRWWVAEADGSVVGCARIDWHGRHVGILASCAVARPYRHRGIGTELVRRRIQEARRQGKRTVALCTMYYQFRHYKKLGFRTTPRKQLPDEVRSYPQFTVKRYMKCAVMIRRI